MLMQRFLYKEIVMLYKCVFKLQPWFLIKSKYIIKKKKSKANIKLLTIFSMSLAVGSTALLKALWTSTISCCTDARLVLTSVKTERQQTKQQSVWGCVWWCILMSDQISIVWSVLMCSAHLTINTTAGVRHASEKYCVLGKCHHSFIIKLFIK